MAFIDTITLEVADPTAAQEFYDKAFDLGGRVRFRASEEATSGFRGFHVSLLVKQPADADALLDAAVAAGATTLKPAAKSLWGYGGVVQAPDGTIWKAATSKKKDTAPPSKEYDEVTLLLGVEDVSATKRFYVERGLPVSRSFGSKYVEFDTGSGPIALGLYKRRALAKDAGVPPEGSGSHRLVLAGDAGAFVDPDGFRWEAKAETTA